jgi:alcohol dehydrogenase class IV
VAELTARGGPTRLRELGVRGEHLPEVAAQVEQHPALAATPSPPREDELLELLRAAL